MREQALYFRDQVEVPSRRCSHLLFTARGALRRLHSWTGVGRPWVDILLATKHLRIARLSRRTCLQGGKFSNQMSKQKLASRALVVHLRVRV